MAWQVKVTGPSYSQAVLATNPVGYWRLGEPSGTNAVDAMGANNGTYVNTPTLGVAGLLTGDSDTAVTLASASLQKITTPTSIADTFTIAAWVKRASIGTTQGIFGGNVATAPNCYFHAINVIVIAGGFNTIFYSSSTITDTTTPHFIVWTKSGATSVLYIDGVATTPTGGVTNYTIATQTSMTWGQAPAVGSYLNGTLDEPAIWNRALSPTEVASLYAIGSAGAGVDLTSAVLWSSLSTTNSGATQVRTASFDVIDLAGTITAIQPEADVEILLNGSDVFRGTIKTRSRSQKVGETKAQYKVTCQDYMGLLADNVVDQTGDRNTVESDAARIAWLLGTWGTKGITVGAEVQTIIASMPTQNFKGMTLFAALEEIARVSNAAFYVGMDKKLHYFLAESTSAPFNYSDNPNGSTTLGYDSITVPDDTATLVNAVFVIGTGISGWRTNPASIALYGRHEGSLTSTTVVDAASLAEEGDAYLALNMTPLQAATITSPNGAGLIGGMNIQVTNALYGFSSLPFRVAMVTTSPLTTTTAKYTVALNDVPVSLTSLVGGAAIMAQGAVTAGVGAAQSVADLSIGGANLVPNSSFENASSTGWSIGANWVFGYTSAAPFNGLKVARTTVAAQTAGDFLSPIIPLDRTTDWMASLWSNVSVYTSGTTRFFLREYDVTHALLAETAVNSAAADATWARRVIHMGPGGQVFQATTTEVRLGCNSAGANATLTWEVDGFQLERGNVVTAYAPSPYELMDASVGTTQIADNSISTQKVIANAITTGKIAAGAITTALLDAGAVIANVANVGGTVTINSAGITLKDAYGNSQLTSGGFAGSWADYISDGLYDSNFHLAIPGTIANGQTTALPNWTVSRTGLTSLTAVADTTWPGGVYVDAIPTSVSDLVTFTSDPAPVVPLLPIVVRCLAAATVGGIAVVRYDATVTFYKADGVTSISSSAVELGVFTTTVTAPTPLYSGAIVPPAAARFASLALTATDVTATTSVHMKIGGGALQRFPAYGLQAYAMVGEASFWLPWATTTAIAANQTNLYPVKVTAPLNVLGLSIANADTTLTRSLEWRLYADLGAGTVAREIVGANGTASWTASVKSVQFAQVTLKPIILLPGSYWLAIRNTQGTNALTLVAEAQHTGITLQYGAGAVIGAPAGALSSTIDFSTITAQGATIPAAWLQGVALGQGWG